MPAPTIEGSSGRALKGLIFDIRSYAIHDGPGIRTSVFFKGCPLGCIWCCNPESQTGSSELLWTRDQCLECDLCLAACSRNLLRRHAADGRILFHDLCTHCGTCVERCPAGALSLLGRWLGADEVLAEVMKDALCFESSGGGLTLTGGEPMAQADFAAELLERYKREEKGCHTAMETCGAVEWSKFEQLAKDVDLFLYDIKHMDPSEHLRLTGQSNRLILDNARWLVDRGRTLIIRFPLVRGINDGESNVVATAEFVRSLPGVQQIDLLPYHRLGEPKYARLGRGYALAGSPSLDAESVHSAKRLLERFGLKVRVGG